LLSNHCRAGYDTDRDIRISLLGISGVYFFRSDTIKKEFMCDAFAVAHEKP